MAYHDGEDPLLFCEALEELGHLYLMPDIQIGRRFVQEEDPRLLCQSAGEHDPLVLPRGKLIERAHREVADPEHVQDAVDNVEVPVQSPPSGMRMPAHQDGVRHGEREGVVGGIGHVPGLLRHLLDGDVLDVPPVYHHGPARGREDLVYAMDERGLAYPVGAQDGYEHGAVQMNRHVLQHGRAPVGELHAVDIELHFQPPNDAVRNRRRDSQPCAPPLPDEDPHEQRASDHRAYDADRQAVGS